MSQHARAELVPTPRPRPHGPHPDEEPDTVVLSVAALVSAPGTIPTPRTSTDAEAARLPAGNRPRGSLPTWDPLPPTGSLTRP